MVFKLRQDLLCHSQDIRWLGSIPANAPGPFTGDALVTASRDKTSKLLVTDKNGRSFVEGQCFRGAQHFVACVCAVIRGDKALVYAGSNDSNIYCFDINESAPIKTLSGHSGVVCALSSTSQNGLLLSGSWDLTARLWVDDKCYVVLIGHEASVWATAFVGEFLLTGSADKTIKMWNRKAELKQTFTGHTDCVRSLATISESQFLSCANDATIRQWDINGNCLGVYDGHENFVYSIAFLGSGENGVQFASCSEDRTLRFWKNGSCAQTVPLPATTLWCVAALPSGDLAVGASNGHVYILTEEKDREAPEEEQKALEEEVAKTARPMQELGDIKVDKLPGKEALLAPGNREGQTKLIREDPSHVAVYQWDSAKLLWVKVGDVVGAAGGTQDPSTKNVFEGKEYDYVFSVDIEDGAPPLKLPYNVTQDPWTVAQEFIHKHELPQAYLDQVAHFIMKNAQGVTIAQTDSKNVDPFTGGSSYHTSSTATPQTQANGDPSIDMPITEYKFFESLNVEGLTKKLKEFSAQVPPDVQISAQDIQVLLKIGSQEGPMSPEQIALVNTLLSWPKNYIFPGIDMIRMGLLVPQVNETLSGGKSAARLIDTLLVCVTDDKSDPNRMVALRALSNMFAHPLGEALMLHHAPTVLRAIKSCYKSQNKHIQQAVSNLLLNFSVYCRKEGSKDDAISSLKIEILSSVLEYLKDFAVDPEAQYRCLQTAGTLADKDPQIKELLKSEDVFSFIQAITRQPGTKASRCAASLVSTLS